MARRLKLTRSELTHVNYQYLGAFRLRVEVSDPTNSGADPYVFLYNRRPVNPHDSSQVDDFMAVASVADLAEYPVGGPIEATAYPIYRTSVLELDFRSTEQAEAVWLSLITQVDALVRAQDRMDDLEVTQEVWVGAEADTGNSASGSDSTSNSESVG